MPGMAPRCLFVFALAAAAPLLTGTIDRTSNLDGRLLAAHNRERIQAGVSPLAWDEGLAAEAREWAEKLAASGRFEHSPDDPEADAEGENLWAGTRDAWAPEEMVGLWIAEKKDYRPGTFPNVSRTGDIENVGHYTQLVWRNTARVGCALAAGRDEDVLVCRYAEGGNVIGERVL